jgi:hypothetical protein
MRFPVRSVLLVIALWPAAVFGCRNRELHADALADTQDAFSSASVSDSASAAPSASSAPTRPALQLLRFTLTSAIRGKEPVDTLQSVQSGQRVWAHFAIRNRSGESRKIAVVFSVNGQKRTTLDLTVDPSWSYRTWAYNTLRKADTSGELSVEATDDEGQLLASSKLPITPKVQKGRTEPK